MPRAATLLRLVAIVLLVAFLVAPQRFAPLFAPLTEYGAPPIYDQGNLLSLALAHLGTVFLAAAASTLVAVGLVVSILQAATQVQESSLTFLPKMLAIVLTLALLMPWMLSVLVEYTRRLITSFPGMAM
jgi:flagellar biosynthesis protein FliQ